MFPFFFGSFVGHAGMLAQVPGSRRYDGLAALVGTRPRPLQPPQQLAYGARVVILRLSIALFLVQAGFHAYTASPAAGACPQWRRQKPRSGS